LTFVPDVRILEIPKSHSFIAGRGRASKSGRNLPVGRPAKVFDRQRARQKRAAGKSWAEISYALKIPITTIRRALAKPQK
jgi:putative DNA-invertase from lambdoid prophage Rac